MLGHDVFLLFYVVILDLIAVRMKY